MLSRYVLVSSCLLAAVTAEMAIQWEGGESGNVKFVGDDTFDIYRAETPQFLAFFFAPWCGHCKAAKPEFAKASEESTIDMVAVDCTSSGKDTCAAHGVSGYPTIKFFDQANDEPVDYDGGRTAKGFLKYLLKLDPSYVPPPFENTPPEEWAVWPDRAHDRRSSCRVQSEAPSLLGLLLCPVVRALQKCEA